MTSKIENLLDLTYSKFVDLMITSNDSVNLLDGFATEDVMGYGTTREEKILNLQGLKDLAIAQREQSAGMNIRYKLTPVYRKIMNQGNSAIIVDEINITIQLDKEEMELDLRMSTIWEFTDGNWKVVHWHGSKPEYHSGGSDTWHKEEWKQKNEELQKLVDEKTAELVKQNRELEIEASLEKVRSRSLAMHHTSELQEVINTVHQQLKSLNIAITGGAFIAINEENKNEVNCWGAGGTADYVERVYIPFYPRTIYTGLIEGIKNGPGFFTEEFPQQEKMDFFKHLFKHPPYTEAPPERKKEIMSRQGGYTRSCVVSTNTSIFIINHHGRKFTDEENDVLKRFGRVFEQSYTRFLDLQKAETQAREAEIQLALERVRARTMAMHKSEELSDTASIMFQELKKLGVNSIRTGVCIFDFDQDSAELWLATEDGDKTETKALGKVSGNMHPMYRQWIDASANKKKRFQYTLSGKEVGKYYKIATSHLNLPKQTVYNKNEIYNGFLFPEGSINIISLHPLTEEESDIGYRFANVFGLLYRRFLDLQKAEAQAREAQIEAALERIRSRTMAMRKSDELQEVVATVAKRLHDLGIIVDAGGVIICTYFQNSKDVLHWLSAPDYSYSGSYLLPYFDHVIFNDAWESRLRGDDFFTKAYSIEKKDSFFNYAFEHSDYKYFPDDFKEWMFAQKHHTLTFAWSKNSALLIPSHTGFVPSESDRDILKRFTQVFEQAYIRFLDIQKAEIQARDALKQASLDRVRGEIASMRTSEDLNRITPVIWRELQALQVPFFRCGVFIINEKEEKVHVYLTTPSGKALAALHLDLDANDLTKNTVEHWRSKRIFKTHWNREEFINWSKSMVQIGQVESVETYQGASEAPESLNLHFVPFRQGMLYVGDVNPLSNEKLDLVKTLAEAFSIAYARYEDFKNLEEAKNKIEVTLTELKAAQSQLIQSEKMASLGELTAGIAHEIQNPLNFVNNFSDLNKELVDELKEELAIGNTLSANEIADDIKNNEEKINHHGKRAEAIVKGMLLHSRGSSGQKELIDINALCDEYLRLSYHGFRAKDKSFNADFKLEADENLPKIEVVPQDFGRVLLNLINNAFYVVNEKAKTPRPPKGGTESSVQYMPTVIITTSHSLSLGEGRGEVIISVKDNGNGIPDHIKGKIFQPFFTTKPTGQGTGLGLSLSYDIVKAHNGTLEMKSQTEGETGTEFIIQIPVL